MGEPAIALVHDELVRRGGAEIVFEELAASFPRADLFALYTSFPRMTVDGKTRRIHTSFLQKFPRWFRHHPKRLLPLLPYAAEQFDFSRYDIVISSASAFVKGVVTRSNVRHLCYCHTPTRYLWERVGGGRAKLVFHYLRLTDYAAAQRVDSFIANSVYTQKRIKKYYRRDSTVVYPPVDTGFFTPIHADRVVKKRSFFLCVGRLSASKHFAQAVMVCKKLGLPLIVIGSGDEYRRLQKIAGEFTRFVGTVSAQGLRQYYRQARAYLQPGVEDFGMAAAEALACGTPVIAFGKGGIGEIVQSGSTGILYSEQEPEALAEAIRQFLLLEPSLFPEKLQHEALKFSRERFREQIAQQVALAWQQKKDTL